jgi:hypothetical protein
MKKLFSVLIFGIGLITMGCQEEEIEQPPLEDEIVFQSINRTINGVGEKIVQIPFDDRLTFKFEIMNLKDYNDNWEAENTDTLAAVVRTNFAQVLDDSEFGYFNALDENTTIDENSGFWNHREDPFNYGFSNSWGGEFKGAGDKYFGFRLLQDSGFIYGWFLVNCTEKSDQLEIKAYAYNKTVGNGIVAGQQ